MTTRVLVLGAGFGGLELSTSLSEALGEEIEVTMIDQSDSFVFGYSKLDVMFGRRSAAEVHIPYSDFAKPGVRLLRETVLAIDPEARSVTTDEGVHEAEFLVIALGADYDMEATPGLTEGGQEFYSVAGAERVAELLPSFSAGRVVIGVCGAPFKCPPAPSEAALLMHDHLSSRGIRDECEISLLMPLPSPVPPSPEASAALLAAFSERDIEFHGGARIAALDPDRSVVALEDGDEAPYDLFLGVPRHRAPDVVRESGMTTDGYVPVDSAKLETVFPGVYAVGDVATVGVPKAGVFSEGAAKVVAAELIARIREGQAPGGYDGRGSCYVEFGSDRVGRVDIDFLTGPKPTGVFQQPSATLVAEKVEFGSSRTARWFGA